MKPTQYVMDTTYTHRSTETLEQSQIKKQLKDTVLKNQQILRPFNGSYVTARKRQNTPQPQCFHSEVSQVQVRERMKSRNSVAHS